MTANSVNIGTAPRVKRDGSRFQLLLVHQVHVEDVKKRLIIVRLVNMINSVFSANQASGPTENKLNASCQSDIVQPIQISTDLLGTDAETVRKDTFRPRTSVFHVLRLTKTAPNALKEAFAQSVADPWRSQVKEEGVRRESLGASLSPSTTSETKMEIGSVQSAIWEQLGLMESVLTVLRLSRAARLVTTMDSAFNVKRIRGLASTGKDALKDSTIARTSLLENT